MEDPMTETTATKASDVPSTARLKEQAATVKDDVRELGRLTKEVSQEKLREARQTAGEYVSKGRERAGELEDSVVTYVRDNPVKSVLMAAGAGALLAFLLSRR
jgi:ElaB/YqjD/DUF883 family membrane-anchored ribosome-binding protein